jgi:hypothetical protein
MHFFFGKVNNACMNKLSVTHLFNIMQVTKECYDFNNLMADN